MRVSVPQFWLLGAASATAGAMIAHQHRASTGLGQHVDASCQQAAARTLSHAPQYWDLSKINLKRQGPFRPIGEGRALRVNWECADGYVNFIQPGSVVGGRNMKALCAWMEEEGFGDAQLSAIDFGAIVSDVEDPEDELTIVWESSEDGVLSSDGADEDGTDALVAGEFGFWWCFA